MRFEKENTGKTIGANLGSGGNRLASGLNALGGGLNTGLSGNEKEWKKDIFQRVVKMLDLPMLASLEDTEARSLIRETCEGLMAQESLPFNIPTRLRIVQEIENEILGLGPLEQLLNDSSISDILVNGPNQIYIERHGKLELSKVHFDSEQHLMTIIDRIVSRIGRRIDESSPMVDARLQDGSRVNAIIPPLAIDGPQVSIRRFAVERMTVERLVELKELTPTIARALEAVVRSRLNVLISGGTGSGKTTLLNVLSSFIPADERIVTIEDSAELQLQQPHKVRLETRPPNIEGKGEVTQRDLVRNSLRMRPDRIVIGEVRGAEALDMLQAMNTGHDGSLTTIHANTARDALTRVESMVAMSGVELPTKQIRGQIASALDIIVQLERMEDGVRRVTSVQEVQGLEGDVITLSEIFRFQRQGLDKDGGVLGDFVATGIVPKFQEHLRHRGIDLGLEVYEPKY
jgi:pilus assembly protein CpaF